VRLALASAALLLACGAAPGARAVVIASEPASGNASAPATDDPGFDRVGVPAVASVVYVGNGWVITANHVGPAPVTLGGVVYTSLPETRVTFQNSNGTVPDLSAYRIEPQPDFPILPIRATTPEAGTPVIMIGHGVDRGGAVSWNGHDGFVTLGTQSIRWGTNLVEGAGWLGATASIATVFDVAGSEHEAQGVYGDSGGPVFAKNAQGAWELAGIMYAIDVHPDQPGYYVLDGNVTYAVDLAAYRDQIIAAVRPECSDEAENDADGAVDFPLDAGCTGMEDLSEAPDCQDGLDNDGDGLVDYGVDPGCRNRNAWVGENPACDDGEDNDGDGLVDLADPACSASPRWWTSEATPYTASCGLGFELVFVVPPLAELRRRLARTA
jgi:hypothetical protein